MGPLQHSSTQLGWIMALGLNYDDVHVDVDVNFAAVGDFILAFEVQ